MTPLVDRLKERKLVQWALAYLAGAWVLLQVFAELRDTFAWPPVIVRALTVLLAVGFFGALVIAWYHGEKGHQRVSGAELLLLAALLAVAGAGVSYVAGSDTAPGVSALAAVDGEPERITFAAEQGSVAVLPFVNLSGDPAQEYFSDGLTEELLNELAQIAELRVAARTSSFAFKRKNVPVEEIARQLRVGAVVEGSVRRDGERLRVTAQLINASTGYHLWSESYDRELTGIFQVQEELARSIAGALRVRLAGATGEGRRTTSIQAHDLYLLGLHHWHRREVHEALSRHEQAVTADSAYGQAWAGIALTQVVFPIHTATSPHEAMPKAKAAALRALALDSTLAPAYAALALVAQDYEWDWPAADRSFRGAIALNPSYATAHQWYSAFLATQRRHDEALALAERAVALDPLLPTVHRNLATVRIARGEYESALAGLRHAAEARPETSMLWQLRTLYTVLLS
jgi:TolB-like protein